MCTASRPTTDGRRPTTDDRRLTDRQPTDNRRWTTDDRRPTTDDRPRIDDRRPTTDGGSRTDDRPTIDDRRPTDRPTDDRQTIDDRRTTIDDRRPTTDRRSRTDDRPTVDDRRPTDRPTEHRRSKCVFFARGSPRKLMRATSPQKSVTMRPCGRPHRRHAIKMPTRPSSASGLACARLTQLQSQNLKPHVNSRMRNLTQLIQMYSDCSWVTHSRSGLPRASGPQSPKIGP